MRQESKKSKSKTENKYKAIKEKETKKEIGQDKNTKIHEKNENKKKER